MNPQQMQAYRQYPQAQRGQPASRSRPGESDARTNIVNPSSAHPKGRRAYTARNALDATRAHYKSQGMAAFNPRHWQLPTPDPNPNPGHLSQYVSAQQHARPAMPYRLHGARSSSYAYQQMPSRQHVYHHHPNQMHDVLPQYLPQRYTTYPCLQSDPGQVPASSQQYAAQQAQLQQQRQQQQNAVLEHQLAQRRAKKPTDRNMPDDLEDMIIGDGVEQYKELREQERRLDYAIMRKRLDLQETFSRNNKRQKTMRIWISNTANNQPWQRGALEEDAFDFQSTGESTARVQVEGRLLDDPDDDVMASDNEAEGEEAEQKKAAKKTPPQKMSHFFKAMTVDFDKSKNNVPDPGWQVEWKKQPNANELDVFHFQRKCDENINISINLTRDEQPERYRLSSVLASTLDMEEGDRAEVVMAIWEYIRCFNLQEDEDKRSVRCDEQLRQASRRAFVLCTTTNSS